MGDSVERDISRLKSPIGFRLAEFELENCLAYSQLIIPFPGCFWDEEQGSGRKTFFGGVMMASYHSRGITRWAVCCAVPGEDVLYRDYEVLLCVFENLEGVL